MNDRNEHILNKFQNEEKKSRKRMFLYSSIPLIITIILIVVSYLSVINANKEVKELRQQKELLQENITELNANISQKSDSLAEMRKIMELAVNYKDKRFEFNYSVDKSLYSSHPRQTEMLSEMRAMIRAGKVQWHLGGNSPEEGFDSPSFAAYMINRHSLTSINAADRYKLKTILPSTQSPETGDVVFYEHGYAMFYFEYRNKPFVVGMTPLGLSSLNYDFGPKRIGFGKVRY